MSVLNLNHANKLYYGATEVRKLYKGSELLYLLGYVPINVLNYNPILWLDAFDNSTFILNSGAIQQWNDKSGNSNHFVKHSSSFNAPTFTDNAVNFNASQSQILVSNRPTSYWNFLHNGSTKYTIFLVGKITTTGAFLSTSGSIASGIVGLSLRSNPLTHMVGAMNGVRSGQAYPSASSLDFNIICNQVDLSNTNQQLRSKLIINNSAPFTQNTNFGVATDTNLVTSNARHTLTLGGEMNSSNIYQNFLTGSIKEIRIFNREFSETEVNDHIQDLNNKYSIF